jgi:two-component system, NarL family, sensor histidine kinase DesK
VRQVTVRRWRPAGHDWWRAFGMVYLLYLLYPAADLWHGHHRPPATVAGWAVIVAFVGLYVYLAMRRWNRGWLRRYQAVALAIAVVTVAAMLAFGDAWTGLPIYAGVAAALAFPARAAVALAGLVCAVQVVVLAAGSGLGAGGLFLAAQTLVVPIAMVGITRLISQNYELRAARADVARLAVAEERLRFARDLHDLLGHCLSTIVLKTELARRLAEKDGAGDGRAVVELADIERIARQALVDVRETVSGYRELSLPDELDNAREVLTAAGVGCEVCPPGEPLPALVEALLAWVVREGTTNVLRHARASHCLISVTTAEHQAVLVVLDDGVGPTGGTGNGIAGLAERLAAVGGKLTAGPAAGRGFRLAAVAPLCGRADA